MPACSRARTCCFKSSCTLAWKKADLALPTSPDSTMARVVGFNVIAFPLGDAADDAAGPRRNAGNSRRIVIDGGGDNQDVVHGPLFHLGEIDTRLAQVACVLELDFLLVEFARLRVVSDRQASEGRIFVLAQDRRVVAIAFRLIVVGILVFLSAGCSRCQPRTCPRYKTLPSRASTISVGRTPANRRASPKMLIMFQRPEIGLSFHPTSPSVDYIKLLGMLFWRAS